MSNLQQIVTRQDFARMCGVSAAAITKAMSGKLSAAASGKYVDAAHPDAVQYLLIKTGKIEKPKRAPAKRNGTHGQNARKIRSAESAKKPAKKKEPAPKTRTIRGAAAKAEREKQGPPPKAIDMIPEDIRQYAHKSFAEVVEIFGTDFRFKSWLMGAKSLEDITEKRIKNETSKGELVSKQLVIDRFLDPVNTFHQKLLTDGAKTIASRTSSRVKAGDSPAELEKLVRKQIERFLGPMRKKIIQGLKDV